MVVECLGSEFGSAHAYTVKVTDTTAAADDLNALDGKTSVDVDVTAVTEITGAFADIKALYDNKDNFVGLGNEEVVVSSGTIDGEETDTLLGLSTGVLTATVDASGTSVETRQTLATSKFEGTLEQVDIDFNDFSAAEVEGLLSKALASAAMVDATGATSNQLHLLASNSPKIAKDGITGTFTIDADVSATQITALLGKTATDGTATVTVNAEDMSAAQITAVHGALRR